MKDSRISKIGNSFNLFRHATNKKIGNSFRFNKIYALDN